MAEIKLDAEMGSLVVAVMAIAGGLWHFATRMAKLELKVITYTVAPTMFTNAW